MKVVLGLGSNLEDRKKNILNAIARITKIDEIDLVKKSKIIESKPWGKIEQPDFLNAVIEIETKLNPEHLLEKCLQIEKDMGRIRSIKYGPRKIDIDILFYEDLVIHTPDLVIPHPEIHKRKFVLKSLIELKPDYQHPVLKKTLQKIYEELE